ncbi:MAG TPA: hypothetical protein VGN61_06055, partial [Verrucomicrobiae bacterium]
MQGPEQIFHAPERKWDLSPDDLAAYSHVANQDCAEVDLVDDRVWADLELTKIFQRFDRAITPLGAEYLFALLRRYQRDPAMLAGNAKTSQELQNNPSTTARIRGAMAALNREEAAQLADFLFGKPPETPAHYRFFYLLSALSIACPFGLFFSPWFLAPLLGLCGLNVLLHHHYGRNIIRYADALKSLAIMLNRVPILSSVLQGIDLPEATILPTMASAARATLKQISRAFRTNYSGDFMMALILEYLNMICLFELTGLCSAIVAINKMRPELGGIFRVFARLDAFQGLASVLSEHPVICVPDIRPGRQFILTDIYHP